MEPVRIEVNIFKKRLDKGEPIFIIDSRSTHSFAESDVKIPGSIRLHFREIEGHLTELPRDRTIVTYCT
jgi:rhodanese-related sulfurtransferase